MVWCRGTVGDRIFSPWVKQIENLGGKVLTNQRVTDLKIDDLGQAKAVICGEEIFTADAVIFAVGITGMKKILAGSSALQSYPEFRNLHNLNAVDVLSTRLWNDERIETLTTFSKNSTTEQP